MSDQTYKDFIKGILGLDIPDKYMTYFKIIIMSALATEFVFVWHQISRHKLKIMNIKKCYTYCIISVLSLYVSMFNLIIFSIIIVLELFQTNY